MDRVRKLKLVLWALAGLVFAVATTRFVFGLGATTNLSDVTPWGLWIGFDVLGGVALAAGGFVITATVYILRRDEFHPIVRPTVLTAFLGYCAVIVGLMFDVGLPWNIWSPMVHWQHHSALFEVAWCVMLYTTVLLLEFSPVPMEESSYWARIRAFLMKIRLPLVILGICLSTLHQSSLGSLFLIMPHRVHALWYSPILPILFFVSAISLGLLMVIFESVFTAYFYRRHPETTLLAKLGGAARWALATYLALRLGDLAVRGELGQAFAPDWRAAWFWLELSLAAIVPIVLLSIPRTRRSNAGQWAVALTGVLGFVLNRIDTGGFMHSIDGSFYIPAWSEFAVSAGVVAAAGLAFLFAVERFKVWEERPADPLADPLKLPEFDAASMASLGAPSVAARTKYSMAFVAFAAAGFALLSSDALSSQGIGPSPAHEARGWAPMSIDGNLDGYAVVFPHDKHIEKLGGEQACVLCHHMNLPRDTDTGCYACHKDMYKLSDAFGHVWHGSPEGANLACFDCHREGEAKTKQSAKTCDKCHRDLIPAGAKIEIKNYAAPGYVEAMHRQCIGCHAKKAVELQKPDLPRCANCHKAARDYVDDPALKARYQRRDGKGAAIPGVQTP
ncbi:MAG: Ni/Fe-hydrogenase cytochrome b subunit [Myxococcales bacterium]|nr:MAG: Ni/Fe-hydrogenase cytochrome b subunit [Myxococcales bacterium]